MRVKVVLMTKNEMLAPADVFQVELMHVLAILDFRMPEGNVDVATDLKFSRFTICHPAVKKLLIKSVLLKKREKTWKCVLTNYQSYKILTRE